MRLVLGIAGMVMLAVCWIGPVPALAQSSFAAHMTVHMVVVALAPPLLVLSFAGCNHDPVLRYPGIFSPVVASIAELIAVWAWHAPHFHHSARHTTLGFAAEQATFLVCGLWLWLSAFGGERPPSANRAATGVIGLLLTSIHMTLLGALLLFATRTLYVLPHSNASLPTQTDQQLGGAIMLLVGGASYLCGALYLMVVLLRRPIFLAKASAS